MNKNYIWTLPTRVFHSSFVLLIVICYLTGDDDTILIHAISGYLLLVILFLDLDGDFLVQNIQSLETLP